MPAVILGQTQGLTALDRLRCRGCAVCCALLVFALALIVFAGQAWVPAVAVLLNDAVIAAIWMISATALGGLLMRGLKIGVNSRQDVSSESIPPLLYVSSAAGLGLGLYSLAGLLLGLAGWMNRPVAIALPVASILAWSIDGIVRRGNRAFDTAPLRNWLRRPAGLGWFWLIPVLSLATVCVAASIMPGVLWGTSDPSPYDVLAYHLQVPREWFELGRIVPLRHNVFSFFPFNVEIQFLWLMHAMAGPWNAMYACQFISAGYGILMVLAVAGATFRGAAQTESGASESDDGRGAVAAAMVSMTPWVIMLAGVCYVESALMLYTALATIWTWRWLEELEGRAHTSRQPGNGRSTGVSPVGCGTPQPSAYAADINTSAASTAIDAKSAALGLVSMAYPRRVRIRMPWARRPCYDKTRLARNFGHAQLEDPSPAMKSLKPGARRWFPSSSLLLAGLFVGIGCGVKITAVPMLLAVLCAAVLLLARPFRRAVVGCVWLCLIGGVVLSPWLIRTAIWSGGNPIFPVATKLLGPGYFSPGQIERFTRAHSPRADQMPLPERLKIVWSDGLAHWQYGYVLAPATLAAAVLGFRQRRTRFILLVMLGSFLVWIGFTHLLARFLTVLIPLAGLLLGSLPWRRMKVISIAIVALTTITCLWGICPPLARITHDDDRSILLGVQDLSFMVPQELGNRDGKTVALVGEAQTFLYQIPMDHLRYKSVFDLPADANNPWDAWLAGDTIEPGRWLMVVNPMEIERLHRTYAHVPGLPGDYTGPRDRAVVVPR